MCGSVMLAPRTGVRPHFRTAFLHRNDLVGSLGFRLRERHGARQVARWACRNLRPRIFTLMTRRQCRQCRMCAFREGCARLFPGLACTRRPKRATTSLGRPAGSRHPPSVRIAPSQSFNTLCGECETNNGVASVASSPRSVRSIAAEKLHHLSLALRRWPARRGQY